MKKIYLIIIITLFSFINTSKAENSYMFGGAKLFSYGIETSDLQALNTSLVNLGFSSSLSSTDNSGIGFDFGVGFNLVDNFAIEVGYVDYGTLEINTTLTGPSEKVKTEISGNGVTGAGVLMFGDAQDNFYIKGGMHRWEFEGTVTASLGSSTEPLGTGTDLMMGVGYNMGNWVASYDYYYIEDGDISSIGIGYKRSF